MADSFPQLPELIDRATLHRIYGIKFDRGHGLLLEREGRFPRRVYLAPKKPAWRRVEIEAWLSAKLEARAA